MILIDDFPIMVRIFDHAFAKRKLILKYFAWWWGRTDEVFHFASPTHDQKNIWILQENIYAPSSSEPSAAMRQNRNCGPNRGRVYLSIGIICIIELVVLYGLCVPAFYSLSTLDSPGTSSAVRDAENIGQPNGTNRSTSFKLSTSFGMALDQLQVFLENIAPEGGAETDRTIASVNASLAVRCGTVILVCLLSVDVFINRVWVCILLQI